MPDLDADMGGLHPSDLIILAGRPGMGKTAIATNIAYNVAKAWRGERRADGHMAALDGGNPHNPQAADPLKFAILLNNGSLIRSGPGKRSAERAPLGDGGNTSHSDDFFREFWSMSNPIPVSGIVLTNGGPIPRRPRVQRGVSVKPCWAQPVGLSLLLSGCGLMAFQAGHHIGIDSAYRFKQPLSFFGRKFSRSRRAFPR